MTETAPLRCVCGDPVERWTGPGEAGWIHSPGSDTRCLDARPRCPHCGLPHDLTPGSMAVRLCTRVRSPEWQASVPSLSDVHPTAEPYTYQPPTAATSVVQNTVRGGSCSCGGQGITHLHNDQHQPVAPATAGPAETIARLRQELDQARQQLAAFHEGEEPYEDEATVGTPGQFIWIWNRATLQERLETATAIREACGDADRCRREVHDGRLAELREALDQARDDKAAGQGAIRNLMRTERKAVTRAETAEAATARVRAYAESRCTEEHANFASAAWILHLLDGGTDPTEGMGNASYLRDGGE